MAKIIKHSNNVSDLNKRDEEKMYQTLNKNKLSQE